MGIYLLTNVIHMNVDEMRKKIIKDKFDKLKLRVFRNGNIALVSDDTYGLYYGYDSKLPSFGLNPHYFMFNFIGLDGSDSNNYALLKKYLDYIRELVYVKYGYKDPSGYMSPYTAIDYDKENVKHVVTDLFDEWDE